MYPHSQWEEEASLSCVVDSICSYFTLQALNYSQVSLEMGLTSGNGPWNFTRTLSQRGTIHPGIMELLHLGVSLFDCGNLRLPLQQLQSQRPRTLAVVHLLLAFRIVIVAQDKLFVESLFS